MRAGTDADVILVAPVGEVVAALLARPRMIADLVGGQAPGFGQFAGQCVEVRRGIVGKRHERAPADVGGEARAGLDRELIERQMSGAEGERAGQLGSHCAGVWSGRA